MNDRVPERLTPLAASFGFSAFIGDLRGHCNLSSGHGSLRSALARARRQLDFVSVTVSDDWPAHFESLSDYDRPGTFTAFPGYPVRFAEAGDYTVLFRDLEKAEMVLARSPPELLKALGEAKPDGAMAFPHHIGYSADAHGIRWERFDPRLSPLVEIVSAEGSAERSATDRPYLGALGPSDGASTMIAGLWQGYIFGVVGNSGHASAYPGSYGHGRTAVYATENTRAALWDGLTRRRTNALTGDDIHLFAAIDETIPGGTVRPVQDTRLRIEAVAGGFIDCIDVIRNGRIATRITPELSPAPISTDETLVETILVLEMGWGAAGRSHRWTGTLWLSDGELVAVEPRLRGSASGDDNGDDMARIDLDDDALSFDLVAPANPNGLTPATQAIALRVWLDQETSVHADFNGHRIDLPATRLFQGAVAGHLGPADGPAYRFHRLPEPKHWQWRGTVPLWALADGESIYVRLRQNNGQMAWTSPIYVRAGGR